MIYASTWVVLETFMLVSQTEKDKYYPRFHLYEEPRISKNQRQMVEQRSPEAERKDRVTVHWVESSCWE